MSRAAQYARLFDMGGRRVTLRRNMGNSPAIEVANVRARIRGFKPEEIAGGIDVGQRKILILAEDIPASFLPMRQNDRVIVDGITMVFATRPDDQTHRDGELLLAIDGIASGA